MAPNAQHSPCLRLRWRRGYEFYLRSLAVLSREPAQLAVINGAGSPPFITALVNTPVMVIVLSSLIGKTIILAPTNSHSEPIDTRALLSMMPVAFLSDQSWARLGPYPRGPWAAEQGGFLG